MLYNWKVKTNEKRKKDHQVNCLTFFDVETPDSSNNSFCSIGIIHQEENERLFSKEYLVNPEARFDNINMGIYGIAPKMVEHAPVFPQIWEVIKEYFTKVVVAHFLYWLIQLENRMFCTKICSGGGGLFDKGRNL